LDWSLGGGAPRHTVRRSRHGSNGANTSISKNSQQTIRKLLA